MTWIKWKAKSKTCPQSGLIPVTITQLVQISQDIHSMNFNGTTLEIPLFPISPIILTQAAPLGRSRGHNRQDLVYSPHHKPSTISMLNFGFRLQSRKKNSPQGQKCLQLTLITQRELFSEASSLRCISVQRKRRAEEVALPFILKFNHRKCDVTEYWQRWLKTVEGSTKKYPTYKIQTLVLEWKLQQ